MYVGKLIKYLYFNKIKVVSILLVIFFWRQPIGWNYCAANRRFGLVV